MKRVCLCLNSWIFGGVEEHVAVLAGHLRAHGYEPWVMCPRNPALQPLRDRLNAIDVPWRADQYGNNVAALAGLLRSVRIDLLHLQLVHYDGGRSAVMSGKLARLPIVATHHAAPPTLQRSPLRRTTLRGVDQFIAVSEANRVDQILHLGLRSDKVTTVRNGIVVGAAPDRVAAHRALTAELGVPTGTPLVGLVGRLSPQKQPHLLVEAMAGVDAHLVVVGSGELREEVAALARERGVRAHFLGFRDDVPQLLAGLDLLAMSSAYEGLPMVLLESMAAGTPVVAFAVDGIPEVVSDGDNGYLVTPNDVVGLHSALRRALSAPSLSAGARQTAGRFSAQAMAAQTAAVYDRVFEQRTSLRQRFMSAPVDASGLPDMDAVIGAGR